MRNIHRILYPWSFGKLKYKLYMFNINYVEEIYLYTRVHTPFGYQISRTFKV